MDLSAFQMGLGAGARCPQSTEAAAHTGRRFTLLPSALALASPDPRPNSTAQGLRTAACAGQAFTSLPSTLARALTLTPTSTPTPRPQAFRLNAPEAGRAHGFPDPTYDERAAALHYLFSASERDLISYTYPRLFEVRNARGWG